MYPNQYFGLFPPFPRNNRVFVGMSFDEQFHGRWENVLVPAINRVDVNGDLLEPHRVNTRRISDSILTEILDGISNDQLVIADVTAIDWNDDKPIRNGNVMYEVGIAHAIQLPEEVLLFRSNSDQLLFDISNVRVNSYDPESDCEGARAVVEHAIGDALNERDLQRQNAIKMAAKSLDNPSWTVLIQARIGSGSIQHFPFGNLRNALGNAPKNAAIGRLLGMGALETNFSRHSLNSIRDVKDDGEILSYKLTEFGNALIEYMLGEALDVNVTELLKKLADA